MKRIFNIIAFTFIAAGAVFTSCRDDSDYPEVETPGTIEIVSRELSFPAAASQGSIVVKASRPVTVTTDVEQPWMTATVEGNIVTVNVTENTSLYGRISNLTLHSGTGSTQVSVIQSGLIFDIGGVLHISSDDSQKTFTYPVKANANVTVSSNEDWCHPSIVGNELIVELDANTTGHIRRGTVTYKIGSIEDEIAVCQCDFDKDVAGDCLLYYTSTQGKMYYLSATLARSGSNYTLDIGDGDVIPVLFDANTGSISVVSGKYIRDYDNKGTTQYLYTMMWDLVNGYITYTTSVGMIASLEYTTLNDGTPVTVGFFEDNGVWGTYTVTAIRLEIFKSKTFSSANRVSNYFTMVQPYIVKIHTDDEASSSSYNAGSTINTMNIPANKVPFRAAASVGEEVITIDDYTERIVK